MSKPEKRAMIFGDSYADNSVCEVGAGAAFIFCLTFGGVLVWAFAWLGYGIGIAIDWPVAGVVFGVFGIPILAMLVNGQMGMRREER
jgi:hypothetical protein